MSVLSRSTNGRVDDHHTRLDDRRYSRLDESSRRRLDEVFDQAALEVAVRAVRKSKVQNDVKVGVNEVIPTKHPSQFLHRIAQSISHTLMHKPHLFALMSPPSEDNRDELTLLIFGSDPDHVSRCSMIATAKFTDRIQSTTTGILPLDDRDFHSTDALGGIHTYLASIYTPPSTPMAQTYDIPALFDILRKATFVPLSPLIPPPSSRSASALLSIAQSKLQRLTPLQALEEVQKASLDPDTSPVRALTFIIDIRTETQKIAHGRIPGAIEVERNDLPWVLDPREGMRRLAIADRYDLRAIVICQDGDASSFAAKELMDVGLLNATDVVGGFVAWKEAGLPYSKDPVIEI